MPDASSNDDADQREALASAIEQEFIRILTDEHGLRDVEFRVDRHTGARVCNHDIGADLIGRVFAQAAKQAIIKRVRDAEGRDQ